MLIDKWIDFCTSLTDINLIWDIMLMIYLVFVAYATYMFTKDYKESQKKMRPEFDVLGLFIVILMGLVAFIAWPVILMMSPLLLIPLVSYYVTNKKLNND